MNTIITWVAQKLRTVTQNVLADSPTVDYSEIEYDSP